MKQLTQVLRTLSMKPLKRSMLILHVMTYSLMQMPLILCPSLLLLEKRNWWIKWQASRVVWRSSQEENTSTRKFSSTMHVTMAREVLVHFRSQIKALLLLRRSRLASSRKLVHIANIAKSPGTTLGSAPYHHALFPLYQRITHQCFKITIFFWVKWRARWRPNSLAKLLRSQRRSSPSNFGSQKLLSHMCKAQSLFGFLKLKSEFSCV